MGMLFLILQEDEVETCKESPPIPAGGDFERSQMQAVTAHAGVLLLRDGDGMLSNLVQPMERYTEPYSCRSQMRKVLLTTFKPESCILDPNIRAS